MGKVEFIYYVQAMETPGMYSIAKFGDDSEPEDVYQVTLYGDGKLWCDCMGFTRQKYPKAEHKHILLVHLYKSLGEPDGQQFVIEGTTPRKKGEPLVVDLSRIENNL